VTPDEIPNRIALPEIGLAELVFPHAGEDPWATGPGIHQQARIPNPIDFAISLQVYVHEVTGTCPFCGHTNVEDESEGEQNDDNCSSADLDSTFRWDSDDILRKSFSIRPRFN
jgi:hypothetical protein